MEVKIEVGPIELPSLYQNDHPEPSFSQNDFYLELIKNEYQPLEILWNGYITTFEASLFESKEHFQKSRECIIPELETWTEEFEYTRKILKLIPSAGKFKGEDIFFLVDLDEIFCSNTQITVQNLDPFVSLDFYKACIQSLFIHGEKTQLKDITEILYVEETQEFKDKVSKLTQEHKVITLNLYPKGQLQLFVKENLLLSELKFLLEEHFQEPLEIYHENGLFIEDCTLQRPNYDVHFMNPHFEEGKISIFISYNDKKTLLELNPQDTLSDLDILLRKNIQVSNSSFLFIPQLQVFNKFMFDKKRNMKEIKIYSEMKLVLFNIENGDVLDVFDVQDDCASVFPVGNIYINLDWDLFTLSRYCSHLQGFKNLLIPLKRKGVSIKEILEKKHEISIVE